MNGLPPILLVEDDENDILLFQRAVRDAAIRNPLAIARDGQEAIEYLDGQGQFANRTRFPLPCLIILDIKMPRKTGLEVLEWLANKESLRVLPVIMFSSSPRAEDIADAYRLGANAFIVKPSSLERRAELARVIKSFWLEFNQAPVVSTAEKRPEPGS
jgi:CheY-like chemotaxis protein